MEFLTYLADFILHIDAHLFELVEQYGTWIYAILFIIVFCETGLVVTPFLPGDSLLFASGVVAGTGLMGYGHVLLVLLAAGITGDAVNYFIGRHVGPAIFQRDSRLIKKEHLLKAHHFYEKHGGKAIILARFVPIVRTFAPFVAGIALMCPHRFFLFNITGCVLWVGGLVSAGYFLGNLEWVRQNFGIIVYLIIIISVLPVAIEVLRARLGKKPEQVEELKNPFEKTDCGGLPGEGRPLLEKGPPFPRTPIPPRKLLLGSLMGRGHGRMCPWLLSPGDAEETIRMFFALVRPPAVAMKKAPHCAGLFSWAGFGGGRGAGGGPLFCRKERGPPP